MKPIDIRNDSFAELQGRIDGERFIVFESLKMHGPCTTRELAERMARDIMTVRPLVTELVDLMAVECVDRKGHEGVYRARPLGDWAAVFATEKTRATTGEQMVLRI